MTAASTPHRADAERLVRPPRRSGLFVAIWVLGAGIIAVALPGNFPAGALVAALAAAVLVAVTLVGAFSQRAGFYARPINAIDARAAAQTLCLTFDDGPDPIVTPKVIELLAQHGHRCTFFVLGSRAAEHPELISALDAAGHEVAIHSMSHAWHLCFWPPARIVEELYSVVDAVAEADVSATPLFRPPNGIISPRIPLAVAEADVQLVGYSRRAYDRAPRASANGCLRRLRPHLRPGAILVLHDTRASVCLEVLPALLDELHRRGLVSRPVGEAITLRRSAGGP